MEGVVTICPSCKGPLAIERLRCLGCGTAVEGQFRPSEFDNLTPDQGEFVRTFLRARGNIREVERELGISYPTVRNRLDEVLAALGMVESGGGEVSDVLRALETGDIDVNEAVRRITGR